MNLSTSSEDPTNGVLDNPCEDFTKDVCSRCTHVRERFIEKEESEPINKLIPIHTTYDILREGGTRSRQKKDKSKTGKKRFISKVAKAVSALRNSGGGVLLVHVDGTSPGDRCLEYFDEAIRKELTGLLESGELYTDVYERKCLCEINTFEDVSDFVLIEVKRVDSVCTVDFNTKATNDSENLTINSLNIKVLLRKTNCLTRRCTTAKLPGNVQELQENRHIQLKTFKEITEVASIKRDAGKLTDYIWNTLKLKDNITSMSKVVSGGSYFLGVSESSITTEKGYTTKIPKYTGFKLEITQDSLRQHIYQKLESDICVLDHEGTFKEGPKDLIEVIFHTLPGKIGLVVLEVIIRYCNGVVFYDKLGPRTYLIESGEPKMATVCRMNRCEWLQRSRIIHSHVYTQAPQE